MATKDYYKILNLPPQATLEDIKKSFRKLALRYHPDTNQGNPYALAWFREVQEAYDVLTHAEKKEAYLQERWLAQSSGKPLAKVAALTPATILVQAQEVYNYSLQIDHFRMNEEELQQLIAGVLRTEHIEMLHTFNETDTNAAIMDALLKATLPLSWPFTTPLVGAFERLANTSNHTQLLQIIQAKKRAYWWHKHQGWVIAGVTVVLCLALYFLAA